MLTALRAELTGDPTGLGYAPHIPHAPGVLAEMLNALTTTAPKSRHVCARTILAEIWPEGAVILNKLDAVAGSVPAVRWAMEYLRGETGIDVGHPGTREQIAELVAGDVLTEAEAQALLGMALQPASRADVLGLGHVSEADVRNALEAQ